MARFRGPNWFDAEHHGRVYVSDRPSVDGAVCLSCARAVIYDPDRSSDEDAEDDDWRSDDEDDCASDDEGT